MKQKRLKLAILLFAMTFIVGTAFAATNGMLAFGGTVRINNVTPVGDARLEFINSSIRCLGPAYTEIVVIDGRQHLTYSTTIDFCRTFAFPTVMSQVDFEIQNTGDVPVELLQFTYSLALGQMVEVTIWDEHGQRLNAVMPSYNHPASGSMIIQPGAVVTGKLIYNPLTSVMSGPFPEDFEVLMFEHNFALDYRLAN